MKSILDPSFHYRSSVDTDLRRTFKRVRQQIAREAKAKAAQKAAAQARAAAEQARIDRIFNERSSQQESEPVNVVQMGRR